MSEMDALLVLGASYDTKEEADADYDAIKALYREVQTSRLRRGGPRAGRRGQGPHHEEARGADAARRREGPPLVPALRSAR
jgi:hypothetical protein